jgi:hypothetical protein
MSHATATADPQAASDLRITQHEEQRQSASRSIKGWVCRSRYTPRPNGQRDWHTIKVEFTSCKAQSAVILLRELAAEIEEADRRKAKRGALRNVYDAQQREFVIR